MPGVQRSIHAEDVKLGTPDLSWVQFQRSGDDGEQRRTGSPHLAICRESYTVIPVTLVSIPMREGWAKTTEGVALLETDVRTQESSWPVGMSTVEQF
jgi:hypothetical protein